MASVALAGLRSDVYTTVFLDMGVRQGLIKDATEFIHPFIFLCCL